MPTDASHPDRAGAWIARREAWLLAAIVLLGIAVRGLRWQVTAVMFNDGPIFLRLAEAFARWDLEAALSHPYHPLYSALIAALSPAAGSLETAAVAVSALCGGLAAVPLWRMVRAGLSPTHGVLAAALLSLHPIAIEYSGDVQSEGLYLLLFLSGAAAALSALRRTSAWRAFAAGALCGLAYLTRPEGLAVPVTAGLVAGLELLRRERPWRATLGLGLAMLAGLALVAAPYVGWMRSTQGEWILTQKKSVTVLAGVEEPQRRRTTPAPAGASRGEGAPPAWRPLVADVEELFQTHVRTMFYPALFLLLLAALFGIAARPDPTFRRFVVLGFAFHVMLLFGLVQGAGYVSGRHALPPLTLLLGHAAGGGLAAVAFVQRRWPRLPQAAAPALLILAVASVSLGKPLRPDRVEELAERRAAEWLHESRLPVHAVAARRLRVAWYAGAPFVEIPEGRTQPADLRALGVSHLILDEEDRDHYPHLAEDLRPPQARPLRRLEANGRRATVYQLAPPDGR